MLKISNADWLTIRRQGEQSYPNECCGVLLGSAENDCREVVAVMPCANTRRDSPHNRYHIDPRELVRIQRQARERHLDIVGFYHSHPDHPARWSQTDLDEAHWIGCSYVITSIERGQAQKTNSFALTGAGEEQKHFRQEEISLH